MAAAPPAGRVGRSRGGRRALSQRGFSIGFLGVTALVLLRIGIGWHFLYQGLTKVTNPDFSSKGYISQAKGPLAEHYLRMLPDYYGHERLSADKVLTGWRQALDRATTHFVYSAEQKADADKLLALRQFQLESYLADNQEAIDNYFAELERWQKAEDDPRMSQVDFQRKRIIDQKKKLLAQAQSWLAEVDRLTETWHLDLDRLASTEQRSRGPVPHPNSELERIDKLTVLSNLAVGVCLTIGLFTPVAALGGAAFLAMLVGSQWPWPTVYPPDPPSAGSALIVNKEVVEMLGLLVVAATGAGRWGGLDYFLGPLRRSLVKKRSKS